MGRYTLKWESYTEFVTYDLFSEGPDGEAFSADAFSVFPDDWLSATPGQRVTSALLRIEPVVDDAAIVARTANWFLPESLAISRVLDDALVIAADFHIDAAGHMRFAVFTRPDVGNQRIDVLREERFEGCQTFDEFMMMRRFDPAMRTVTATDRRLQALSKRALRAGDLLRTKVEVSRFAQNQALLISMDRRADLQLRLQKTVEGLSVVAVSYYAVNIALYLPGPLEKMYGISKTLMVAGVTPVILLCVWLFMHRIEKHLH